MGGEDGCSSWAFAGPRDVKFVRANFAQRSLRAQRTQSKAFSVPSEGSVCSVLSEVGDQVRDPKHSSWLWDGHNLTTPIRLSILRPRIELSEEGARKELCVELHGLS